MARVQTITGEIDSADLGFTLMHEHILIANPAMRAAFDDWVDTKKVIELATAEAKKVKERGVSTLVDLTPPIADKVPQSMAARFTPHLVQAEPGRDVLKEIEHRLVAIP